MKLIETAPLFDKERTYSLRGICMLMIIIHHIVLLYGGPSCLRFTTPWGYLGTGVFFFLSGYGLFCSLKKFENISVSWIISKLAKMLLPFIFAFCIYILLATIFEPCEITSGLLTDLLWLRIPHTTSWFLKAILGLYVTTYIVFCTTKGAKNRVYLISLIVSIFFIFAYFNLSAEWHWTILNFPLGMLSALYLDNIKKITTPICKISTYLIVLGITIVFFFALRRFGFTTLSSIVFTTFSMLVILKFNICNRLFDYVGAKSINFYIFQMVFLHFGLQIFQQWWLYFVFVMTSTFVLSIIYDSLTKKINL